MENWFKQYLKSNLDLLTTLGIFSGILALLYQIQPHYKEQIFLLIILKVSFTFLFVLNVFNLTTNIWKELTKDKFLSWLYDIKIIFINIWQIIALTFLTLVDSEIDFYSGRQIKFDYSLRFTISIVFILIFTNISIIELTRRFKLRKTDEFSKK